DPGPGEFAADPLVAPRRVLTGQAQDRITNVLPGRWPSWTFPRLGPLAGSQVAVPAQQRGGVTKKMLHDRRGNNRESTASSTLGPVPQIGPPHPAGAARRPGAGARGSRPPWPGHRARAGSGTERYGRGSGTAQTRTRPAIMPATRASSSHDPAAQQHRSGFSPPTGSARLAPQP